MQDAIQLSLFPELNEQPAFVAKRRTFVEKCPRKPKLAEVKQETGDISHVEQLMLFAEEAALHAKQ